MNMLKQLCASYNIVIIKRDTHYHNVNENVLKHRALGLFVINPRPVLTYNYILSQF